jgi:hypothetical protein
LSDRTCSSPPQAARNSPVSGFDALRTLVGFQADLVDVVAASGEGAHHL